MKPCIPQHGCLCSDLQLVLSVLEDDPLEDCSLTGDESGFKLDGHSGRSSSPVPFVSYSKPFAISHTLKVSGKEAIHLLIVILIIIGIPSPTHSFTLGLNPPFSANPPYCSLSFFSFRFHYMDFPDCLLLLLSISVFLLFLVFLFLHFFSCRFRAVD